MTKGAMMDTFDSRALRYTDCYGQRFMRPGVYRYGLGPAGACVPSPERSFRIEVAGSERPGGMATHYVTVRKDDARLQADPPLLAIAVGDLVIWHCPHSAAYPYVVDGEADFFGSAKLVNESGFSHAFTSPGEYAWADAHGSRLHGVVHVATADVGSEAARCRWLERLRQGALVLIDGDHAEPARVEIVTGQTVFFTIVKGPGVTITDRRLLHYSAA
jgi:plastocyanin